LHIFTLLGQVVVLTDNNDDDAVIGFETENAQQMNKKPSCC